MTLNVHETTVPATVSPEPSRADAMDRRTVLRTFRDSILGAVGLSQIVGCSPPDRVVESKPMTSQQGVVLSKNYEKGLPLQRNGNLSDNAWDYVGDSPLRLPDTHSVNVEFEHDGRRCKGSVDNYNLYEKLDDKTPVVVTFHIVYRITHDNQGREEKTIERYRIVDLQKKEAE